MFTSLPLWNSWWRCVPEEIGIGRGTGRVSSTSYDGRQLRDGVSSPLDRQIHGLVRDPFLTEKSEEYFYSHKIIYILELHRHDLP